MATCPSCASLVEEDAASCWHCGAAIVRAAAGEFDGPHSEAPTLLAFGEGEGGGEGEEQRQRTGPSMLGREIIGQYVIVGKLGEGGMGEVFLADQPSIGRQVAIKIVHPQLRDRGHDDHVERFRNEAKAAASLESPHIVSIFNWGELDDGTLFMAMEYLPGRTLAELIRELGVLEPSLAVTLACQVCTALTEAHGAGIVHRDLKPSNIILLERRGEQGEDSQLFAKVLDFGVAKLEGSDITRSGAMFGTPQYMSPEQLRGESNLDGRSDLYSLGVMLYEMLVGELPFSSPTAVGFITAHLHDAPPTMPTSVPRRLTEVVMQLLAKEADERPPTAEAVADELWAALGGRATMAGRRARQRGRQRAARRLVGALVGLGLLAAASYGGWALWIWRGDTEAELERERAQIIRLREELEQQTEIVNEARDQARKHMTANQDAAQQVQVERQQVRAGKLLVRHQPSRLDAETQRLLNKTRSQLEDTLLEELERRQVPPSEIAAALGEHERRIADMSAGKLGEATVREQLVVLIGIYRQRFPLYQQGDALPLPELERVYLNMSGAMSKADRQVQLDDLYADYDRNISLSAQDRPYYKRLAVAELIREFAGDPAALDQALRLGKEPTPRKVSGGAVVEELPSLDSDGGGGGPTAPEQALPPLLPSLED